MSRRSLNIALIAAGCLGVLSLWIATRSGARDKGGVLRGVLYAKGGEPRDQSLDLYMPRAVKGKPPLVVFVQGDSWSSDKDEQRIGQSFAETLAARGVAVALARHRSAPDHPHPAQARDVAAAVAYLFEKADEQGYDSHRIFLAGHAAGAHLAALVGLDPSYLKEHGVEPQSLAGVIAISGIYDLQRQREMSEEKRREVERAFGGQADVLKAASPISYARAEAPPFMILAAAADLSGSPVEARRFADALRAAGHSRVERWLISGLDPVRIAELGGSENLVRHLLLAFLKLEPLSRELREFQEAKKRWWNPPFSTLPFWKNKKLVRSYPIDRRFLERLAVFFGAQRYEFLEWPLERYHAVDLFAYLDTLPKEEVGAGRYLITNNIRDERQFWTREEIEPYEPVIVVGIDDERNLFRFNVFYKMLREYSWKEGPKPPLMARPLGAFIHFLKPPPERLQPQSWHYSLTPEGFRLAQGDPIAPLRDLPKGLYEVFTFRNGCIHCHGFRGTGSQAHHTTAFGASPHGGYALPLVRYPSKVWRSFVFNQRAVAKKMGAIPNMVNEKARKALYILVDKERRKRSAPTKAR